MRDGELECNPDIDEHVAYGLISTMVKEGYIDGNQADIIKLFIRMYNATIDNPSENMYKRQVMLALISQVKNAISSFDRFIEQNSNNPSLQETFIRAKEASVTELNRLEQEFKKTFSHDVDGAGLFSF